MKRLLSAAVVGLCVVGGLAAQADATASSRPMQPTPSTEVPDSTTPETSEPVPSTEPTCSILLAADDYSMTANTTLTIAAPGVLGNDTTCGEDIHIWESAREGSLTLNADGSFTYTPAPGFTGDDSFLYFAGDTYPGPGNALTAATIHVSGTATPTTAPPTTPPSLPRTL